MGTMGMIERTKDCRANAPCFLFRRDGLIKKGIGADLHEGLQPVVLVFSHSPHQFRDGFGCHGDGAVRLIPPTACSSIWSLGYLDPGIVKTTLTLMRHAMARYWYAPSSHALPRPIPWGSVWPNPEPHVSYRSGEADAGHPASCTQTEKQRTQSRVRHF